jgi:hypothetical protein
MQPPMRRVSHVVAALFSLACMSLLEPPRAMSRVLQRLESYLSSVISVPALKSCVIRA